MGREIGNPLALVPGHSFLPYLYPMYTTIDSSRRYYPAKPARFYVLLCALMLLVSCHTAPAKRYGFLTMLGQDTISVESIIRQGNTLETDEVDRFPRVRIRHAVVKLH